jgi:hypothetical protein
MWTFTVSVLCLTLGLASLAARDDPWERLWGFEPVPGTLGQLDNHTVMGMEYNSNTRASAVVIYSIPGTTPCQEGPCLLLVIAFVIYNEQGEVVTFHADPGVAKFYPLLFLSSDLVET